MAKWVGNEAKFKAGVVDRAKKNLLRIAASMVGDIKKSMKTGYGAYTPYAPGGMIAANSRSVLRTKTGKRHWPAPPGSPPAVDYGRLMSSITFNWSGSGMGRAKTGTFSSPTVKGRAQSGEDGIGEPPNKPNTFTVVVGTNLLYGKFQEIGTVRMLPRPYIRPVWLMYKGKIMTALGGK